MLICYEFYAGDRQTDLSKVTVSFPVRQLLWNQKRLGYSPQPLLGQLVFWMVLMGTSPAWSLSLLTERSPTSSKQADSEVKPLETERLASGNPDQAEANLMELNQSHLLTNPDILRLAEVDRSLLTGLKKERLPLSATQKRSLRSFSAQVSQSLTSEKLSLLSRSLPVAKSVCWKLQPAESSCRFSSSKLTFNLDKPTLTQAPFALISEVPPNPASTAPADPELGVILAKPAQEIDPELGLPRLRERILEPLPLPSAARQPSVYLIARVDYFRTTNVFSGIDPVKDGLIRSGLTVFYAPAIGRNTYLVTSIDGNLIRYGNLGYLNYNELRFRAGVLQRLTPRTFGEIGWSNQQLFATREGLKDALRGDRFLNDNAIRFELSRQDALSKKLALNTFYQFRVSFADPSDRSRLINSFITSLSYSLSPNFQTAIDYQLAWSHFTQQPRDDVYHQLVARLTYTLTSQSQLNVFSGVSFGYSSDARINFDGFILGVGLVLNLPLF